MLTVSADVYRPAAIAQLQSVTEQVGADFFPSTASDKPVDIALAALDWAKKHYHDVLIIDTAGRLGIDEAMMQEIAACTPRSSRSKPCSWSTPCWARTRSTPPRPSTTRCR